jgi:hypothetical protein
MKILTAIKNHCAYWKETYVFLPLSILLAILSIYGVNWFTGRPLLDSPDFLVGVFYSMIKVFVVVASVGFTQNALFGYRNKDNGRLIDDVYDAGITCFLLVLFSYLFWN